MKSFNWELLAEFLSFKLEIEVSIDKRNFLHALVGERRERKHNWIKGEARGVHD